ncbi:MAG: retention module-containing protein, partial [Methylophilaceae bacterium]
MAVLGTVIAINGTTDAVNNVMVVNERGEKRVLHLNDSLQSGETIITPPGVIVELQMANGKVMDIFAEQTVKFTPEFADAVPASSGDSAIDQATIQAVIKAIDEGRDIGDVLEETAAGINGGGGVTDYGFTPYYVPRIVQILTPLAFQYDINGADLLRYDPGIRDTDPNQIVGGGSGTVTGVGPSAPTISSVEPGLPGAGDDAVPEGTSLVYNVSLSSSASTPTSFAFNLGGGTASTADIGAPVFSNGVTYNSTTGQITVPAGVTSFTVTVATVQDPIHEGNETLPLTIGGVTGTGTIIDDDPVPTITSVEPGAPGVGDDAVIEGTNLVYNVNLSNPSSTPTSFVFNLGGGTAGAGDIGAPVFSNGVTYNSTTGQITVPAGVTAFSVTVPTVDDAISEPIESVPLTIGGVTGTGQIIDNDSTNIIIDDVTRNEGAGTITFTVSLTLPSSGVVTVDYASVSGTALVGTDVLAGTSPLSGTLTFAPGQTTQTITLNIVNDNIFEGP